jgi:hypothetical protein
VLYQVVHEDPAPLSLFLPPEWDAGPLQVVLIARWPNNPRPLRGMMELARAFEDAAERTDGATGREAHRAAPRRACAAPRRPRHRPAAAGTDTGAARPAARPAPPTPEPLVLAPARQRPRPRRHRAAG